MQEKHVAKHAAKLAAFQMEKERTLLNIAQNVTFELFQFWHFPPFFVLLKFTCLVTLFDRLNVNARNVKCDFLSDFQTLCT